MDTTTPTSSPTPVGLGSRKGWPSLWPVCWATVRTATTGLRDAARWHPGWLVLAGGLYLVQSVLPAAQVLLITQLLHALTTPQAPIAPSLLGLTVVVGAMFPVSQVAWNSSHRLGLRLNVAYQSQLVRAAARLNPRQLRDPTVVASVEAADAGSEALSPVPGQTLQLVSTMVTAVSLCAAIGSVSAWSAALVALALVPTVVVFTAIAQFEMAGLPALGEATRRARYATELLVQQRSGHDLAVLQSAQHVADKAIRARSDYLAVLDALTAKATRWELGSAVASSVLLGGALTVMVVGQASVVTAAAAIAGVISALHAVRASAHSFGLLVSATPKVRAFHDFLRLATPHPIPPVDRGVRTLDVDGLTFTYPGAGTPALVDVSLRAKRGEIIALVGANGAGKTTTINCIVGALDPDSGSVCLDGSDLSTLDDATRLVHFGLLSQDFGRYEFTVRDNLLLASAEDPDPECFEEALRLAGLEQVVAGLPEGIDSQLGQQWSGVGLSGGQWQRLALARVRVRNAGVWILDEPTSAIDAESEQAILERLQRGRHERITLLISHRAWTLRAADRIYVFDGGRIVQVGNFAELSSAPGRFAELFAEQWTGSAD